MFGIFLVWAMIIGGAGLYDTCVIDPASIDDQGRPVFNMEELNNGTTRVDGTCGN